MQHPMLKEVCDLVDPRPHMSMPMSRGDKPLSNTPEKHHHTDSAFSILSIPTLHSFLFNSNLTFLYLYCVFTFPRIDVYNS